MDPETAASLFQMLGTEIESDVVRFPLIISTEFRGHHSIEPLLTNQITFAISRQMMIDSYISSDGIARCIPSILVRRDLQGHTGEQQQGDRTHARERSLPSGDQCETFARLRYAHPASISMARRIRPDDQQRLVHHRHSNLLHDDDNGGDDEFFRAEAIGRRAANEEIEDTAIDIDRRPMASARWNSSSTSSPSWRRFECRW